MQLVETGRFLEKLPEKTHSEEAETTGSRKAGSSRGTLLPRLPALVHKNTETALIKPAAPN